MKTAYDTIIKARNESSTKLKLAILMEHKGDESLKEFLRVTYAPEINFYMKKVLPAMVSGDSRPNVPTFNIEAIKNIVNNIGGRSIAGNAAKTAIANLHRSLENDWEKEMLELMIQRDVKAGFSISTINKVWPGLVKDVPYMRCSLGKDLPKGKTLVDWDWDGGIHSQCLSKDWQVEDSLGNRYNISDIVDGKLNIKVKSYNFHTNSIEYNKITNWFDNGESNEDWYEVTYLDDNGIATTKFITGNHQVFMSDGSERLVSDLSPGDDLFGL